MASLNRLLRVFRETYLPNQHTHKSIELLCSSPPLETGSNLVVRQQEHS